ncbi:helix-turn-helix domain-containing protein [Spirosoma sp. KNUC1025]|uniref:helix-turn-helix domain-containing protein n=1 Tax=Spirosoma sp. KNUC1025 TaxID=2894082 RepID=UPI00386B8575|nr:helix-turn-helix domain-containing protein [Spirosoma sp. KNUC1025]
MFIETQIAELAQRLGRIEAQQAETLQLLRNTSSTTDEKHISTDEAAKKFGIAKQTLYQNAKKIKHTKRFGRLYWLPSDIREYISSGRELIT